MVGRCAWAGWCWASALAVSCSGRRSLPLTRGAGKRAGGRHRQSHRRSRISVREWSKRFWSRTVMRSRVARSCFDSIRPQRACSSRLPVASGSWSRPPRPACWRMPRAFGDRFPGRTAAGRRDDPRAANAMAIQTQLLHSRQAGLQAELGAMKSMLAGLQSSLKGRGDPARQGRAEQAAARRIEGLARTGCRWLSAAQPSVGAGTFCWPSSVAPFPKTWEIGADAAEHRGDQDAGMVARQQEYEKNNT